MAVRRESPRWQVVAIAIALAWLLAILAPFCHSAEAQSPWKAEHTALAVLSTFAITVDWGQAAGAARDRSHVEENPFLGPSPSIGQLRLYNAVVIPANLFIGYKLPAPWRTIWFAGVTGFQLAIISHNVRHGVRLGFRF